MITAIENGSLDSEIVPVTVTTRKGEVVVKDDEQPHNANIDKIPTLKPAFKKDAQRGDAALAPGFLQSIDQSDRRRLVVHRWW